MGVLPGGTTSVLAYEFGVPRPAWRAVEALARAMVELAEAEDGVARALEALDFDPMELERVEERLFAIRGLARKHNVAPDDLPGLMEDMAGRLEAIDHGGNRIAPAAGRTT